MSLESIVTKIAKSLCADHVRGLLHFNGRIQGIVEFVITQKNHVHLSTPSNSKLKLRNDEFHVSLHLFEIGSVWQVKESDRPYITRNFDDAPPSFKRIIVDELVKGWNEHIKAHPEQTNEANRNKIKSLESSIELKVEIVTAELKELKDLYNELISADFIDAEAMEKKFYETEKKYHH